ncbi:MAG TPA: helix-turn-helix domain-containing protein [Aggregatilineales bacterium]|nr:helix-turn-helix domain-containing protein [Aggregatilineales bacterium]
MSIDYIERQSESPYVETITRGRMVSAGSTIRPATCHWHMVFVKPRDRVLALVVGPWTTAGVVSWPEGAEVLWIKFKLGTFMPHLPTRKFRDSETQLPEGAFGRFWLHGSTWQYPDYDNAETFVERLVRDETLVRDPLVNTVLNGYRHDLSSRTVRHRFLQATGLPQGHIYQIERAQRAETLLRQGKSILDTVDEAGYFDQPHLTRSLKQWIGHTPAQILQGAIG